MRQISSKTVCFAASTALATLGLGTAAMANNTTSLSHSVVLEGLENPWDMAFLDDGTMFYTEKCLGLSVMLPGGETVALLGMTGTEGYAATADDLFCEGQAGMNGVAIDPDFANNRTIYVYSASTAEGGQSNHVMRMTVADDFSRVADRTDIISDIAYKPAASDHPFGGPGAHNGGRLRFGPDGFLWVTTGDTHNGVGPQSPTMIAGKILRIDGDGNAAPDNGAPDGFDARIYTYGHRNVQGIAFHPATGAAIAAEHGPWHSDEITLLRPGGNAGWDPRPNMAGRAECPDDYCGYSPNQLEGMDRYERASFMPMTDMGTYPDAIAPMWDNNGWSQGTSSAEFLVGEAWGAWENHMVVGIMGIGFGGTPIGQRIDVFELSDDGSEVIDVTEMTLPMDPARFRSLVLGPDGALYAAVDQGMIHRMAP